MAINDLPILSALRTKMQWHQERQRVLAENISNANTPNFSRATWSSRNSITREPAPLSAEPWDRWR